MLHPNHDLIALTIQQPWAELILRGIKTIEVRTVSPGNQSLVYLYASRKTSRMHEATEIANLHSIDLNALATGQIVGTVRIDGARKSIPDDESAACLPWLSMVGKQSWLLHTPERLKTPITARYIPYGMWFYPFQRRQTGRRKKRQTNDSTV